jgi:hypothetical protein
MCAARTALSLFDGCATRWLPGHDFASRHPSDNPNLAITVHPESAFCQRDFAAVHSAGGVVTFIENQPAMSLQSPDCTDHRYSLSKSALSLLILKLVAPRHGFEPQMELTICYV